LLECDTRYSRAAVEKQRCIGALESLRIEVSEELGAVQQSDTQPASVAAPDGATEQPSPAEPPWVRWEVAWSATLQAHESAPGKPSGSNGFLRSDPSPTGVGSPSERSDAAPPSATPPDLAPT